MDQKQETPHTAAQSDSTHMRDSTGRPTDAMMPRGRERIDREHPIGGQMSDIVGVF